MVNKRTIPQVIMRLYDRIIRDKIGSCMPAQAIPPECICNGFYALSPEDTELLETYQLKLLNSLLSNGDEHDDDVDADISERIVSILTDKGSNWTQVTQTLKALGKAKLRRLYMLAMDDLLSNPHRKVIIGAWYVEHILWLQEAFKEFGSLIIYGDVKKEDRGTAIELFQRPDDKHRVMIINPTVVGMCVPLDDQHGEYPRSEYILPDYRLAEIVQTTGRVIRETTKSPLETKIRIVYADQFQDELKIINTALTKSLDARMATAGKSGLVLPDQYATVRESIYIPPDYPLPELS